MENPLEHGTGDSNSKTSSEDFDNGVTRTASAWTGLSGGCSKPWKIPQVAASLASADSGILPGM